MSGMGTDLEGTWDENTLGDMHLNSAVNLDFIKHHYNIDPPKYRLLPSRSTSRELRELDSYVKPTVKRVIGFQQLFARMFKLTGEASMLDTRMTRMIMKIVGGALKMHSMDIPLSKVTMEQIEDGARIPRELWIWFDFFLHCVYARSEWIRSNCSILKFKTDTYGTMIKREITESERDYQFIMGKDIVAVRISGENKFYVADYTSLLLLLDTSGQRICAHLCSKMGKLTGVPGSLEEGSLARLCNLGDQLIEKCGNDAYEALGMYEAICVGIMQSKSPDDIIDNNVFLRNCHEEMEELVGELSHPTFARGCLKEIEKCIEKMESTDISNAFCLYRIWGHPTVDIYKGMAKVHKIATKIKEIPPSMGTIAVCQFRKMFMSTYFKKHHRYPPFSGDPTGYVGKCVTDNVPIRIEHPGYNLRDFESVQLGETYRVPDTFDMCHILNDKAVSPDMSELKDSIKAGRGTSCGGKRRGILRWMEGDSINCRSFLAEIDLLGLSKEDLLIGMYEKEREIKVSARMYSLMTERMRYYFVLTEGLIADYILPHFPEITMKDSLNVLIKKMWESGGQRSKGSKDVNINIDFSKWNTNMREDLTMKIFKEMDHVFGFDNLISRTHEIFINSLIYSASGKYLPNIVDGEIEDDPPMCYRGHLGGFEGLRQKGWTVATVCLLAYLSERQKLGMKLMGQGDNQIIRLRMPVSYWGALKLTEDMQKKEARLVVDRFVDSMDILFSGAGLPIKVRETWTSSRLFMYGKVMLLDGCQLPQWYKKTLRSYALSNEGTLTISGVIGTIATNMCSAGGGSETPCLMYLFFLILAEWSLKHMFRYHPFTRCKIREGEVMEFALVEGRRKTRKLTKKVNTLWLKSLLVLIPTAVGGSVTIPMTGFIMRGFPDKASEGYAWLKFLASQKSPIQSFLRGFYTFLPNDTVEADMLIQSPFSLNHKRPPTPGLQTRENIREWLLSTPRFQQNRFINNMKELLQGFDKKKICQELLTETMNPLITHEIYETFGQVYCEGIVSRVENTRTIRTLHLRRTDREPIIEKLMTDEMHYIAYMWWRGSVKGKMNYPCATKQAREARNLGWGRRITGITTPHPLEILFQRVCVPGKECIWDDDHVLSKLVEDGQFPPFLGSKIKTKVYSLQDEEARREPLIKTGARLARQFGWMGMGNNMRDLVLKNIGAMCDVSVFDKFVDDDPTGNLYTGSVMHRFTPASVSEGCFINYAPQVGHRVFMSSDTLPSLSRGQTNYTFHFQAMYCFLQYMVSKAEREGAYHHHVGCDDCVVPVEDEFDDIEASHTYIDTAQGEKYVNIIKNTLGYMASKPATVVISNKNSPIGMMIDTVEEKEGFLSNGILDILCWKAASDILSRTTETYTSVGTEDLQGWPRIYAYKVSRRIVIGRVSAFILFMTSRSMREPPFEHNMERIRRRAIDAISRTGPEGFSGVASLCLGRDCLVCDDEITVIEGFAYPETVLTCLMSVKSSILLTTGKIMSIRGFMCGRGVYPTEGLAVREYLGILSCKCIAKYGCTVIQDLLDKNGEDDFLYQDARCSHNCMPKMIKSHPLINMTLDRAMKYLPIRDPLLPKGFIRKLPSQISEPVSIRVVRREFGDIDTITMRTEYPEIDMSSERLIQYPTSSVYKWADILSGRRFTDHIIVLGDGAGGTSLVAAHIFSESSVYPMALLESKNLIPQDLGSLSPPLSRHYRNINMSLLIDLPDDVRKRDFGKMLQNQVEKMNGEVLILSDIEGAGGSLKTILSALGGMPPGTELLIKTYLKDLCSSYFNLKSYTAISITISPMGNLRYGEVFLSLRVGKEETTLKKVDLEMSIEKALDLVSGTDVLSIQNAMRLTEECFGNAVQTSVSIAFMKLSNWGTAFSQKVLEEDNLKLVGYLYQYINTHYHFASTSYRPGDGRTITPRKLDQLVCAFRSILLCVFGESKVIIEELEKLYFIGAKKGLPGREYFKARLISGSNRKKVSDDEINVGRVLRNYRKKTFQAEVSEGPIGLPFISGALEGMETWGYKVPISSSAGWVEDHLQI
jgi:mRNA capping enzyme